jgi:hypothetical protein
MCRSTAIYDMHLCDEFACRPQSLERLAPNFEEFARSVFFCAITPPTNWWPWQPQGALNDLMLDQIAEWLVIIEKVSLPFKRFVDLSQLTAVAVRTRQLFEFARKRAEQFAGVEPVRAALFCDDWVGFGIARLYESLTENAPIEVRAFRDCARAAEWLGVPVDILTLTDEPEPLIKTRPPKKSSTI